MIVKPDERLLLHAILEEDDNDALDYYQTWQSAVDLDDVEGGSYRLLPLLYRRLAATKQTVSGLERLKGIYRQSLYKNSLLFHRFTLTLDEFQKTGMPLIVLKGIALAAAYYRDNGVRPMSDADILVRERDAEKILACLKERGWRSKNGSWLGKPAKHIHSLDLVNPEGYELDVHWRAFYQCSWDDADKRLWQQTEHVPFKGTSIEILNPTLQILHNCAHGVRWNAISSIRWIVDVLTVLKTRRDAIDWSLLVSEAALRNLSLTMFYALDFLKNEFGAPVPGDVLNDLEHQPKDAQEVRFFRVLTSPPGLWNRVYKKWLIHSYSMGDVSFLRKAAAFPDFIVKAFYQVPFYIRKRIREITARRL